MSRPLCIFPGCVNRNHSRGYCSSHYWQLQQGRELQPIHNPHKLTLEQRFWQKVDKSGECWLWIGGKDAGGYGSIGANGQIKKSHRLSYEWVNGPIPEGLGIDHICQVRACVNPAHLRAATQKQNMENVYDPLPSNKSGVRGVYRYYNKWVGQVSHHNKRIHVGSFETLEEARLAVLAKRNELFTHNTRERVQMPLEPNPERCDCRNNGPDPECGVHAPPPLMYYTDAD